MNVLFYRNRLQSEWNVFAIPEHAARANCTERIRIEMNAAIGTSTTDTQNTHVPPLNINHFASIRFNRFLLNIYGALCSKIGIPIPH